MRQNSVRRRWASALAVLVAAGGLVITTAAGPAVAAPGDNGDDGEGGSKTLIQQVEAATRGFVEAKEALDASKVRQAKLALAVKQLDAELGPRQAALNEIAAQSYRTGRLGPMSALINASSDAGSDGMLDRVQTLQTVAIKQDAALRALKDNRDKQARAKAAVGLEIADQQKQLTAMAKRKAQAENALKAAGQGADAGPASSGGGSTRKASSGGNLGGGCSVNDPTGTGGCITPRLAHALSEAKRANFKRFVKCFREQNSGEHPKGRACDFASDKSNFGGVATGSSKAYGDDLADFFISNANALGVLYVIWFKRIYLVSSGRWKSYSGGNGDPSSDHTNHVHLSVK